MPSMVSVCRRVIVSDLSRRVRPSCAWVRTSCEWVRTSDLPRPKSKHILFPHCRLTARPSPVHRTGLTPRSRTEAACTGAERPHSRTFDGVWALTSLLREDDFAVTSTLGRVVVASAQWRDHAPAAQRAAICRNLRNNRDGHGRARPLLRQNSPLPGRRPPG